MLVDGTQRFAHRTAMWLMHSRLPRQEISFRLTLFPEDFVKQINEEAVRIKKGPPKPPQGSA